jgi:hypothetical protein
VTVAANDFLLLRLLHRRKRKISAGRRPTEIISDGKEEQVHAEHEEHVF